MKRHEVIEHLRRHGCVLIRKGKRHSWWGIRRTIAVRPSRGTPRYHHLVRKICRDLGIPAP